MQKIKKLLKIVFSKEFILQVIKFGIAGGTTSIIDWGVLAICVRVLHMDSMVSNIFAFAISVTYNYWANAKFVFDFDKSTNLLTANYLSKVNSYLLAIGLTQEQINAVQTKLSK